MQILGMARLFQADKEVTFVAQLFENWLKRTMRFDLEPIGGVACDFAIEPAGAAAHETRQTTTTGSPGDTRQIDVAPHGRANDD